MPTKAVQLAKMMASFQIIGVYQLQTIKIDKHHYTLFFDSGCGDFVSCYKSVQQIGDKAQLEFDGTIKLGGIGGITTQSAHGIYS